MDLCDDISTSSNLNEEDTSDPMGKKRKHCTSQDLQQQVCRDVKTFDKNSIKIHKIQFEKLFSI